MNITVSGVNELDKVLKQIPKSATTAIEKELKKVALDLQGKAQRIAPIDLGDLRGSAFAVVGKEMVSQQEKDKDPKSVRMGLPTAGGLEAIVGFAEPYALKQHEEVGYRHPKGGQAKYLETPYKQNRDKYVDYIAKAVKKAVEK
jgi:hypothetical protein